jgi:hypothetical protein
MSLQSRSRRWALTAVAAFMAGPLGVSAQSFWNNSNSDWSNSSSWNGGVPTATTAAIFGSNQNIPGTTVVNPSITGLQDMLSLVVASSQNNTGYNFSGGGTLTVGGTGSQGILAYGPNVYNFENLTLQGSSASALLNFRPTSGSSIVLGGTTTATNNVVAALTLAGGTLVLDNTTTNTANRLATTTGFTLTGGTLELRGNNAAATAFTLGALTGANTAGSNTEQPATLGELQQRYCGCQLFHPAFHF